MFLAIFFYFVIIHTTINVAHALNILNPDFEKGLADWTGTGTVALVTSLTSGCYDGSNCVRTGGLPITNGDSTIQQTFTVTNGQNQLSFRYKMTCLDTPTYDWVIASLTDNIALSTTSWKMEKSCNSGALWNKMITSVVSGHSYTLILGTHTDSNPADASSTLFDSILLSTLLPGVIYNSGFENGFLNWTNTGTVSKYGVGCKSGSSCIQSGSVTPSNGDSSISQSFFTGTTQNKLSFWYKMTCPDTAQYDWVTATLVDNTIGTLSKIILTKTCITSSVWTQVNTTVTSEHLYTLTLVNHDDNSVADPSYTLFDEVKLLSPIPNLQSKSPSTSPISVKPSLAASKAPSLTPTKNPVSTQATLSPSNKPITNYPSKAPSLTPTKTPFSTQATLSPSNKPITNSPSKAPSLKPVSTKPSVQPSKLPTITPVSSGNYIYYMGNSLSAYQNIQIRQWDNNAGYCGEVSVIQAGLILAGTYVSQYDLRAASTTTVGLYNNPQNAANQYLLLGSSTNQDAVTAKNVKLQATTYLGSTSQDAFLGWVKAQIKLGAVISIGVLTNGSPAGNEYDHIVTVSSIQSVFNDNIAHDSDIITLEDHGEWCGTNWCPNDCISPSCSPVFTLRMTFLQLKTNNFNPYWIPVPTSTISNYAIAHYGPIDNSINKQLVRVQLQPNYKWELPVIGNCPSCARPVSSITNFQLVVTVSGLVLTGVTYNLYRYNSLAKVPISNFNANAASALSVIQITSAMINPDGKYVMTIAVSQSVQVIFRCVPSTAT